VRHEGRGVCGFAVRRERAGPLANGVRTRRRVSKVACPCAGRGVFVREPHQNAEDRLVSADAAENHSVYSMGAWSPTGPRWVV
jgi:hypothetical protein